MPLETRKGRVSVLNGSNQAILLCLIAVGGGVLMLPGCSRPQAAMDGYLEALALRAQDQTDLAIAKLESAVHADRGFVLAYSELGKAYLATGNLDKAAAAFAEAAEQDAWSVSDHLALAQIRQKQGRLDEAVSAYERVVELAPEDTATRLTLAECQLAAGRPAQALAEVEAVRQIDAESPAAARLLGRIYEAENDGEKAIAAYQQWAQWDANEPAALLAIALVDIRKGDCEQAQDVLNAVLQKWPREATAYRIEAYCLLKSGATDRAIAAYERAVELKGDDWEAHRGLGVAYMVKARQSKEDRLWGLALFHWRQSLALNPEQPGRETLQRLIKEYLTTTNPLQGLDY